MGPARAWVPLALRCYLYSYRWICWTKVSWTTVFWHGYLGTHHGSMPQCIASNIATLCICVSVKWIFQSLFLCNRDCFPVQVWKFAVHVRVLTWYMNNFMLSLSDADGGAQFSTDYWFIERVGVILCAALMCVYVSFLQLVVIASVIRY